MELEKRLATLEKRLQAAEDQLEILRLLTTYGPAVDSGESECAARLWIKGGVHDIGGHGRAVAYDDLVAIYDSKGHQDLIHQGSAHLTTAPRIAVNGDRAEAVAYSFVILKREHEDGWDFWRAAVNHWTLARTQEGWRIAERFNRVLDGSPTSHDTLRRALCGNGGVPAG